MTDALGQYFETSKSSLRLTIPGALPVPLSLDAQDDETSGHHLRRAQLGAVFAIAAHFTTRRDAALVVMPTGAGKSAVMTLLPFVMGSKRVLVVTPTKLLREQLTAEFAGLRVLRDTSTFPLEQQGPRTKAVVGQRREAADWLELEEFDVVVGAPSVLSPGNQNVVAPPPRLFDLLIFDEAHHTPAPTYVKLLEALGDVPVALFTATPLRRDKRPIPAKTVYSYSLSQAFEDRVLAPIEFHPVEAAEHASLEERDTAIATAAITRVRSDEHARTSSRIIARTRTIKHARELVDLYEGLGAPVGLITADTTMTRVRVILRQVEEGSLLGLVSVGVLGEGFDLPRLKIAAYHRPHATLSATLQFLGRISRVLPEGPSAELFAIPEDVNDETRDLYNSDTAWSTLVPALADAAVEEEVRRREYLRSFDPEPTEPLSLAGIRPRKDVQVFQVAAETLDFRAPLDSLGGGTVIYRATDGKTHVLVVVTEHLIRPQWLDADTLDRFGYEIHVAVHDRQHGLVFVHGTRDQTVADLLATLGADEPRMVEPVWLDRLMNSVAVATYHSVGMRSARAAGGKLAAYRMMAGNQVGGAVLPSETRSYGTGHGIARVYDPMLVTAQMLREGRRPPSTSITSLGVSYARAKVFSPDLVGLLAFRDWCFRLAALVHAAEDTSPVGLPGLPLRSPRRLAKFPQEPYLAFVEPLLMGAGLYIRQRVEARPDSLELLTLEVQRLGDESLELRALIEGAEAWRGIQNLAGAVRATTDELVVAEPGSLDPRPLSVLLTEHPPTIFYTSGESSIGSTVFQPLAEYADLSADVVKEWAFENTDLRKESKPGRNGMINIKTYAVNQYKLNPDVAFIVDDDRAGEIADLIVIGRARPDTARSVTLVHCKYTSKAPGVRAEDLYEVVAQASRSVNWLDGSRLAARLTDRLRSGSRILHGEPAGLDELFGQWQTGAGRITWTIAIVQPGLVSGKVNSSSNVKTMLSDTLENVAQFGAESEVFGHE